MKKIIIFTLCIIFIPFFIVLIYKLYFLKEIELNYIESRNIRVKRNASGVIEVMPLEEYIVGVLAGEMPIYFDSEALKAQAVASRSYAMKRIGYNKDNDYDVVDSVMNQVYLDNDYLKKAWGINYKENINKLRSVVNETLDEVMYYDNNIIDAMFFSTSNGYTESSNVIFNLDLPYLKSKESLWDKDTSSAFKSSKKMSLNDFYSLLGLEYNKKLSYEVLERSGTNRIIKLKINGVELNSKDVYNKLGLKSYDFSFVQENNDVIINTCGYGHGVGMSQYGALGMAKEGYKYYDILKYYYTGITIDKIK